MRMRKIEICVLNILKREDLEYKVNLMLYLDVYMLKWKWLFYLKK